MDASATDNDALRQRANALYWESDESVNRIAEDLELSKGTLYTLVDPRPSGLPCPRCGEDMEYPNRTARDKGFLTCPACDLEESEEAVREEWRGAARSTEAGTVVVKPGEGRGARGTLVPSEPDRSRVLLGTALLGAAAGLALALWARKR